MALSMNSKCLIALLMSGLFGHLAQAQQGAISSNGAPNVPPPPVPGEIRLSCQLRAGHMFTEVGAKHGSETVSVSKETTLEFLKKEGAYFFACISGCKNAAWKTFHSKGDAKNLFLPREDRGTDTYFPSINMTSMGDGFAIKIHVSVTHRTRAGTLIRKTEQTIVHPEDREMQAHARIHEDLATSSDELFERAKATGESQFQSQNSYVDLSCSPLKQGELSETEIARLKARVPSKGFVSYENFHDQHNMFQNEGKSFKEHLEQAKKIEPAHIKAELARSSKLLPGLISVLREKAIPLVREAMAAKSGLTTGQAMDVAAHALGYKGLAPSAVIALSALPLVMVTEAAP